MQAYFQWRIEMQEMESCLFYFFFPLYFVCKACYFLQLGWQHCVHKGPSQYQFQQFRQKHMSAVNNTTVNGKHSYKKSSCSLEILSSVLTWTFMEEIFSLFTFEGRGDLSTMGKRLTLAAILHCGLRQSSGRCL